MRRSQRGPVGSIGSVGRIGGPMSVARVQSLAGLAAVGGSTRVTPITNGYTFKQALERCERGLVRADPLPIHAKPRPPLPPDPDDTEPVHDELPPGNFLGRLLGLGAKVPR